jgi:hypothetical protein
MGMTAANDWTKELATKGFPDLKKVWSQLGRPNDVIATFNIHWQHNYNHVSRTTMYGFMNKYFNLGYTEPVLEREFVVPTIDDITVWTAAHPKPSGDKVGGAHEKALLRHWSDDSDKLIAGRGDVVARAWELIIGRAVPAATDVEADKPARTPRGNYSLFEGSVRDTRNNQEVSYAYLRPPEEKWNGTVALWLNNRGLESVATENGPSAAAQKLLDAGIAIAVPNLYLASAKEQPLNPPKSKDPQRNDWQWAACYTYGYNPSLVAHRVHDVMTSVVALRKAAETRPVSIIVAASDGAGVVAAAAVALLKDKVAGAVIDTEGFRFASLNDQWHPLFVPGAVKYGDVPGLLALCAPLKPTVLGEKGAKGGADAVAAAVLSIATRQVRAAPASGE